MKRRHRQKILVIDDEKGVLDFFERAFPQYRIIAARTGKAGLRKFRKVKPHLVILDIKLPGMDGIEVLHRLRKINEQVPVIIITAYGSLGSAREAIKLGACDYIAKPFKLSYIREAISKGLEKAEKPVVEEKVKIPRKHCQRPACIWEVLAQTFIFKDKKFSQRWLANPKVAAQDKESFRKLSTNLQ